MPPIRDHGTRAILQLPQLCIKRIVFRLAASLEAGDVLVFSGRNQADLDLIWRPSGPQAEAVPPPLNGVDVCVNGGRAAGVPVRGGVCWTRGDVDAPRRT